MSPSRARWPDSRGRSWRHCAGCDGRGLSVWMMQSVSQSLGPKGIQVLVGSIGVGGGCQSCSENGIGDLPEGSVRRERPQARMREGGRW